MWTTVVLSVGIVAIAIWTWSLRRDLRRLREGINAVSYRHPIRVAAKVINHERRLRNLEVDRMDEDPVLKTGGR